MDNQSVHEKEAYLNVKYGIESSQYEGSDLDFLRDTIESKMESNSTWKRKWVNDNLLKRFLCTFETVEETTQKLVEYFDWRLRENIDEITPENPSFQSIFEDFSGVNDILDNFHDRCGRPIMIINTCLQFRDSNRCDLLVKRAIYYLEVMCEKSTQTELGNFCLVFNLKGWGVGNMDFPFLLRYISILRDYYNGSIGTALVVNYPFFVYPFWNLVKYAMDRKLRSKFVFCRREDFNDFVDVEQMPVQLFGR